MVKSLGEEFIEEIQELMEGEIIWKVKTLRIVGKAMKTVQATFSYLITKENEKRLHEHRIALQMRMDNIYQKLLEKFCFEYSITHYDSPKKISELVYFIISRKMDFQELGKGFDGHYVKMLFASSDFTLFLQSNENISLLFPPHWL